MGREAHDVLVDSENLEVLQVHLVHRAKLLLKLVLRAVNMRVVHLHGTHTHEAEKLAALLVAIAGAVLGEAQGQVAIAALHGSEELVMVRAVHRLEVILYGIPALLLAELHRRKHRVGVVRQVAAAFVHALARNVRRAHALIPGGELRLLGEALQLLDEHGALG